MSTFILLNMVRSEKCHNKMPGKYFHWEGLKRFCGMQTNTVQINLTRYMKCKMFLTHSLSYRHAI